MLKSHASQSSEYFAYCEQVVRELEDLPNGHILANALMAEQPFLHWVLPDEVAGVNTIQVREGYGPQAITGESVDTSFHAYLDAIITPQIWQGILTDGTKPGTYDDRKIRWSGAGIAGFWSRSRNILTLEVGPTSYPRCRLDIDRKPVDALKLMRRGLTTYRDPYAYFARGIGVVVVPLTASGTVYIGKRLNISDYHGVLNFVAGWATFSSTVQGINFYQDAQQELREEVYIEMYLDAGNTQLAGISGNPITGEIDLVFVVQTDIPDRHFQSGHWPEHSCWFGIHSKAEAEALLEQGRLPGKEESYSLMFSSRLGLEYLVKSHW